MTMKTTSLFAASLLAALLSGCADQRPLSPAPVQTPSDSVAASTAVRGPGDLIPSRLVKLQLPARGAVPTLSASMPGLPRSPYAPVSAPEISTRREFLRVVPPGTDLAKTGPITFPISAPSGARVVVTSSDPRGSLPTVHLRDAAGKLLDLARDEHSNVVQVQRQPIDPATKAKAKADAAAGVAATGGEPGAIGGGSVVGGETGFKPLELPRRILTIDVPATAGTVTLDVPAEVARGGLEIDVQEPTSPITLAGAARALQYGFGEVAEVEYALADDGAAIDGASVSGFLELPNGERGPAVTFVAEGSGKYLAKIPMSGVELKQIGVWHLRAKATGSSRGVAFERDIESGFGYAPAHAQMTDVHLPKVLKGTDGVVDEISVDVELETLVDDRLTVAGTLVVRDADGTEHAVGNAETSADVVAGKAKLTLHFDAQDVALSLLDGPFFVRDLALTSPTIATTQHRLVKGLGLATPKLAARDLRYPAVFKPAVEEMFDQGTLIRR
jgi:hypothetical protein